MRHVLGISGKDSLSLALLIKAHKPELWENIELFTTVTGADYPETLEWLNRLPNLLNKPITFIEGDIFGAIGRNSPQSSEGAFFLPNIHARYCTREAKLKPFEFWTKDSDVVLYTGIRADEARIGYKSSSRIQAVHLLQEMNVSLGQVWQIVLSLPEQYQPPLFYWESMHNLCREIWDEETSSLFSLDDFMTFAQKVVLMAGRSRPNCFFCFNQRQYEVVWLAETHPDLFEEMKSFEKDNYSWIKDFPLAALTQERMTQIKRKRAKAIVKAISMQSFGSALEADGFEKMSSCGLFCGK